jgi:hypothetical protein
MAGQDDIITEELPGRTPEQILTAASDRLREAEQALSRAGDQLHEFRRSVEEERRKVDEILRVLRAARGGSQ